MWGRLPLRMVRMSLSLGHGLGLKNLFRALGYLGVFQKSYDDSFSFPNAFWRQWGFSREDMQHHGWAEALHPDDKDFVMAELDRQISSSDYVELPEYRIMTKTGETKWVLSKGVVVERNAQGTVTHYLGSDFDVTERKMIEAKIDAMLRERTTIIRESRHRIRNQLRALDARIDGLKRRDLITPQDLASIQSQLRAIQSVNCALMEDASRSDVDVQRLVSDILRDTRQVFDPEERIFVSTILDPARISSRAASILTVGVQECLANAFQHGTSREGSSQPPGWIHLELADDPEAVRLRVTNSVVPAETKPIPDTCGEGDHGLAILREMVTGENGSLEARYSDADDVWTVEITLPRLRRD